MIRISHIVLLLIIPLSIAGNAPERPIRTIKSELSESPGGVQISFEVKELEVIKNGEVINICFLSADLVNINSDSVSIRIHYLLGEKEYTKVIHIGPHQQKIMLVDMHVSPPLNKKELAQSYSLVTMECPPPLTQR